MATALGAQPSTVPLPTGKVQRVIGGGPDGAMAWPPPDNYFWANTSATRPMQVGPINVPVGAFFLFARAWCIQNTGTGGWEAGGSMLRLTDSGTEVVDATSRSRAYVTVSSESTGHAGAGWRQNLIETCFQCSPGINYYVQFLASGGGGYYYCSYDHIGMVGWTVGEGVY